MSFMIISRKVWKYSKPPRHMNYGQPIIYECSSVIVRMRV